MDRTLICINVFKIFSYHRHNLLKFSYKNMLKNLENPTSLEHIFHPFFLYDFFLHCMCSLP
jgi:hypothetical protein